MKRKEITFDPQTLISTVESFAKHVRGTEKLTLRTRNLRLPPPVKPMKPKEIVTLRRQLGLSQAVFAHLLNIPTVTQISWEKGRRRPTGAALRLLDLVRKRPNLLAESITRENE